MMRCRPLINVVIRTLIVFCCFPAVADTLPVEAFSRLPDVTEVSLSPNGEKVVSLVRYEHKEDPGVAVYVLDLNTGKRTLPLATNNQEFVIGWIEWANDSTLLVSAHYPSHIYGTPTTSTRLLKIDVETGKATSAIPPRLFKKLEYVPVIHDQIIDSMPNNQDEFLVSLRTDDDVASAVFRINHVKSKSKRVHKKRAHTVDWVTDQQYNLRIAQYFDDTTIRYDHRKPGSKKWTPLFEHEVFSASAKTPLGFDNDPNLLYFRALHQGRYAIFKADLSTEPITDKLVYSHPKFDVYGGLVYSQLNQRMVGVRSSFGSGYVFWDPHYAKLQKSLNRALPDTNNKIVDFSDDERRAVVLSANDTNAGTYYLWDRDDKTVSFLASRYEQLKPELMAEKQPIEYAARDGLIISGYLTRPPAKDKPGPTIIFPHGGPISHDGKGFDYWTQYFANRGYNVLQMNFRGSSGYGHDFMTAGLQDWGGKMQTDVEDGTRWLIDQNIADPNKICVVGASYGGYAALMEAANNPELYQCVVSFAGVTDLQALVVDSRRYVNHKVVKKQIGSKRKELKQRSPVKRADEIDVPVLLVHGSKDRAVPIKHGRRMHKRLTKAGKDVNYIELKDGTHYLSNEQHRVSFFKAMDSFLSKHLQ